MTHIQGDKPQHVPESSTEISRRLSGAQPEILQPAKKLPATMPPVNSAPKNNPEALSSSEAKPGAAVLGLRSQLLPEFAEEVAPFRNMFKGFEESSATKRMEILRAFVADCRKGANAKKTDDELVRHYDELNEMCGLLQEDQMAAKELMAELRLEMQRMQETTRETGAPLKGSSLYQEFVMIQSLLDSISGVINYDS